MHPFFSTSHLVDDNGFEQGMFGSAFHPNYAANGYFFLNYTGRDVATGELALFLARFTVSADPNVAQPDSLEILSNSTWGMKSILAVHYASARLMGTCTWASATIQSWETVRTAIAPKVKY